MLLTINIENKSFHSSMERSELYLQVSIPPRLGEIFKSTVFRLRENKFVISHFGMT